MQQEHLVAEESCERWDLLLTEPIVYLTDEQLLQSEYAMLLTRRLEEYYKFYQLGN